MTSPRLAGRAWIGSPAESSGAQVALAAFGVRDAAIGRGAAGPLGGGGDARPWLPAGGAADGTALAAPFSRRDDLPALAALASMGLAVGSIALGLWLQEALD